MTEVKADVSTIDRLFSKAATVFGIGPQMPITEAARLMKRGRVGSLVVRDQAGSPVGIITERDILDKVVAAEVSPGQTSVRQIMSTDVVWCDRTATIDQAQKLMARHGIRHLPICENGRCVGMVSSRDVLAYQLKETRQALSKNLEVLEYLEHEHPGITHIHRDQAGRVVI